MRALENVASDFVAKFPGFMEHVTRTHENPNVYYVTFQLGQHYLALEVVETEDPDAPNVLVMHRENIGYTTFRRMMTYFMRRLTSPPPKSSRVSGQPLSRDLSSEFARVQ